MNILGINCYVHDTSAALIQDGRIVFAANEERLSRVKADTSFPRRAILAALEHGGIRFEDLDAVAFGWNAPGPTQVHSMRSALTGQLPFSMRFMKDVLQAFARDVYRGNGRRQLESTPGWIGSTPVMFIDHHQAHAWSTYALSGFDDSLVLIMDGRGASQSTAIYHARDGKLRLIRNFLHPNSLGAFYEGITDLLGFERHNDEWKVMGLAAYGEPSYDLSDLLRITPGGYRVNGPLVCGRGLNDISALVERFGPRRNPEIQITDSDRDLAASAQHALEQAVLSLVTEGVRLTGSRNLCLAGGVAMNCKANGKLLSSGLVDDVFIQPAATDDGTAIGAALAAHQRLRVPVPRYRMDDAYFGPGYGTDEIEAALRSSKLPTTYVPNTEEVVANLIAEGAVIGWFQGRMEFGPRALGNRSILADARRPEMKDRVNEVVKFREGWRPFAPSCLEEAAGDYFVDCGEAPFMIVTYDVRPDKRSVIPAVTHADNTARVQTVSRQTNPRYWGVIREFEKLTGVPVVMNTSFNLRGEPIVCSPKDAIRTFYSCGLDYLVLGDYIVAKDPAWRPAASDELALAGVR